MQTARYLDDYVKYPGVNLIECIAAAPLGNYSFDEIDKIARELRNSWGLGAGPISNVLSLLEGKGIVVCRFEIIGENIEAFSFWNGQRPFIFMASDKDAGVRLRYDLAHELGHLVLHRYIEQSELEDKKKLRQVELEANQFAGAFLMPKSSFSNEIYTAKLDAFIPLKARWKVSIQAMVYRCRDLDIIDSDQALNLYKQISFRKWRKKEPLDDPRQIPLEQPKLLRRAMELLLESRRKYVDEMLSELCLSRECIEVFCNLPEGYLRTDVPPDSEPTLR